MKAFDVIVVGAGVAGSATAIAAAGAGCRVALFHYPNEHPAWESLPPWGASELRRLGVSVGLSIERIVAWWDPQRERRAIHPDARLIERTDLARRLRARAQRAGVELLEADVRFDLERSHHGWTFKTTHARKPLDRVASSHIVDATGRTASLARRLGARRFQHDRVFSLSIPVAANRFPGTWTERVASRWWTVCTVGVAGTATFVSDIDDLRQVRRDIPAAFLAAAHLSGRFDLREDARPLTRPSGSSRLSPCAGLGWHAVGDAAWTAQPLASCGIAKSLADARLFGFAVRDPAGYDAEHDLSFQHYLRALASQLGPPPDPNAVFDNIDQQSRETRHGQTPR